MKDWIDESGVCYVVYPKMQLMRDLGCTLYRLDQTMEELKKHDLICKWKATSNLCYRCGRNEARRIIGESYERDDQKVKGVTTMEEQEEATVAVAMEDWNGEKF